MLEQGIGIKNSSDLEFPHQVIGMIKLDCDIV